MFVTKTCQALAISALLVAGIAYAEESEAVKTQTLTVEEKLEVMELIEVTSEKDLAAVPESEKDPAVESILEELGQLESETSE